MKHPCQIWQTQLTSTYHILTSLCSCFMIPDNALTLPFLGVIKQWYKHHELAIPDTSQYSRWYFTLLLPQESHDLPLPSLEVEMDGASVHWAPKPLKGSVGLAKRKDSTDQGRFVNSSNERSLSIAAGTIVQESIYSCTQKPAVQAEVHTFLV